MFGNVGFAVHIDILRHVVVTEAFSRFAAQSLSAGRSFMKIVGLHGSPDGSLHVAHGVFCPEEQGSHKAKRSPADGNDYMSVRIGEDFARTVLQHVQFVPFCLAHLAKTVRNSKDQCVITCYGSAHFSSSFLTVCAGDEYPLHYSLRFISL